MDVDPDTRDKWSLPVARLSIGILHSNVKAVKYLADRAAEIFDAMGAEEVRRGILGGSSWVLQHGTCRFGKDPKTSVLDSSCKAHDVPNLFVVDGSFMPSSGGVPTTLTIQANALRVAARIRDAFAKKEL
jgi:choline dehydrogenase-like flavoprotein